MNGLRIAGLIICAVGLLGVIGGGWFFYARMAKVNSWKPCKVRVLSSAPVVKPGTDSNEAFAVYQVRYTVAGTSYDQTFESWASSMDAAKERVARHPAGSAGTVYCNPANPQQIDLNLGMNPATLALPVSFIGGGIAGIVFGLLFVVLAKAAGGPDAW